MRLRTTTTPHQPTRDDALARLLAAENRLAARVTTAREEAEGTLRRAHEDAQRIEAACATTIAASSARLAAEFEARLTAELTAINRESERLSARYEAADDEQVRELVEFVVRRLFASDTANGAR